MFFSKVRLPYPSNSKFPTPNSQLRPITLHKTHYHRFPFCSIAIPVVPCGEVAENRRKGDVKLFCHRRLPRKHLAEHASHPAQKPAGPEAFGMRSFCAVLGSSEQQKFPHTH